MVASNSSKNSIRRPTKIMQQAVNLEFDGKTAEAVHLLEEHKADSEMHTEKYLSHFFEVRRSKGLGPYSLDNGTSNGRTRRRGSGRAKVTPQVARAPRNKAGSQNDVLEMVNESTSTATLLQLQGKTQRLLSTRSAKEVERAKQALKEVAKLKQEVQEALSRLEKS